MFAVFGFRPGPHRHVCGNGPMDKIEENQVLEALEQVTSELSIPA